MDAFVLKMKEYINNYPPNYEYDDINSLLESFGSYYLMCNPVENENIKDRFLSLEPIMKSLSRKRETKLFHTMLDICDEYEKQAFQEGIRVGAQLICELLD